MPMTPSAGWGTPHPVPYAQWVSFIVGLPYPFAGRTDTGYPGACRSNPT
jgi:hypothetical protein